MKEKGQTKQFNTALFDPITSRMTPVEIKYLMNLLEKTRTSIDGLKARRSYIKELNAFIVPFGLSVKERRELMSKVKVPNECWKPYPYNPKYLVSNYGRIQATVKSGAKVFVLGSKCSNGHVTSDVCCVIRTLEGKRLKKRFSHMVMETFCPKPEDGNVWVCAHRDLDIWNNRRDNLQWMERAEFSRWVGKHSKTEIPVVKYDIETGEELDEYRSISEAARQNFMSTTVIYLALKGVQPHACGFGWRVSEDYELKGA